MAETCPQGPSRALQQGTSSTPALTAVGPAALTAVGPTHIARAPKCKLIIEIAQLLNTQQKRHKAHNTTRDQHPTLPHCLKRCKLLRLQDMAACCVIFCQKKCSFFIAADYVTEMPRNANANYKKSPPVLSAVHHQYQCVYFQFQLQQVCIDPV